MKKKILNKKKKAFTLAETLITLTILGIVAAITIPALINRQQEAANKTKVKKAMTMYEKALNQMIIENDLKTNQSIIDFGAEGGACAKTTEYFKKVEEKTPCRFKTADRIWWDITDIENPLIILNDKKKDETVENLQALAKDTNDITTYAMIGRLDDTNSTIRINDNAFEQTNGTDDQKAYMSKLYGFVNPNKASDDGTPTVNQSEFMSQKCTKNADNTTYTCEGSNAKFYEATFTEDCVTLSDRQESCPVSTKPTVVAMVQPGISWNNAQTACPEGTHLIKAAEAKQLWNNGASGNTLESLCDNCSRNDNAWFWTAETYTDYTYNAYFFNTYSGEFDSYSKYNRYTYYRVVCVGD